MKYKLIKQYPGSPNLGEIAEPQDVGYLAGRFRIAACLIENYPEFWEEVKEAIITSKEGIPLYYGDKYYTVYESAIGKVFGPHTMTASKPEHLSPDWLYFADEIVAEKYAYEHKAILSIHDINDAQQRWGGSYFPWTGLLNMAKDKLK